MLFRSNTDLSRDGLTLTVRNSDGYLQDALQVRYTVYSWDGLQVSGNSIEATRKSVGEYYAPWHTNSRSGSYKIIWEITDDSGYPEKITENIFIVDKSDYVCGPDGIKKTAVPPIGSGSFLSGTWTGPGDLPLYIKDNNGLPTPAYAVYWTIIDQSGRYVKEKTVASSSGTGEYYASWLASVPSGDYEIIWEYFDNSDSPASSKRMSFSVICPTDPYPKFDCSYYSPAWYYVTRDTCSCNYSRYTCLSSYSRCS